MIQKITHDFFCSISDLETTIEDKPDEGHSTADSVPDTTIITDTTIDESRFNEVKIIKT